MKDISSTSFLKLFNLILLSSWNNDSPHQRRLVEDLSTMVYDSSPGLDWSTMTYNIPFRVYISYFESWDSIQISRRFISKAFLTIISIVNEIYYITCCSHFRMHIDSTHRFKPSITINRYWINDSCFIIVYLYSCKSCTRWRLIYHKYQHICLVRVSISLVKTLCTLWHNVGQI